MPLQVCGCIVDPCSLRRGQAEGSFFVSFTNVIIFPFSEEIRGLYNCFNLTGAAKQTGRHVFEAARA